MFRISRCTLVVLLLVVFSNAQSWDAIEIAGVSLYIGMPREEATRLLRERGRLDRGTNEDNFIVMVKNLASGKYESAGAVMFEGGQLTIAIRYRGHFTEDAAMDLFTKLYAALQSQMPNGNRNASVEVGTRREGDLIIDSIKFRFGNRVIEISTLYVKGLKSVSVSESLVLSR